MPMQASVEISSPSETLATLIATGVDLFVLASIDDCAPCALMKPIVSQLALRLSIPLCVIEPRTAADFIERHGITRFPELILIRNGEVSQRHVGYNGFDDLRDFMHHAVGGLDERGGAEEIAFRSEIDAAQAEVDAMMAPARAALEPFMTAAISELKELDVRLRNAALAGYMNPDEVNRLRLSEQVRIYAPFQDRIDALRDVQTRAMQIYAEKTDQITRGCAASSRGPAPTLSCTPDGSVCSSVADHPPETAR